MKWADNLDKLNRAIAWAKAQGKTDEATIKARYIEIGGKLLEVTETVKPEAKPAVVEAKKDVKPVVVRRRRTLK